jgi:hypothetical protein
MADRELTVLQTEKLFVAHGCTVEWTRKNFLKVARTVDGKRIWWVQHCHKGRKDKFDRRIVAKARRRLGFGDMPDDEFYTPLD